MYLKNCITFCSRGGNNKNYISFLDPGGFNYVIIVGPTVFQKKGLPRKGPKKNTRKGKLRATNGMRGESTRTSGKKKAHKQKKFCCPVGLGTTPGFVPGISPGLSLGQIRWKSGTNPGFLLILHTGSLAKPGLSPGTNPALPLGQPRGPKGGTESLCEKSLCAFFAR